MWATVPLVTGIFSLAAFVAGVALLAYRARLNQQVALLRNANNEVRAEALRTIVERLDINTAGLTKAQQFELASRQMQLQSQRQLLIAAVAMGVAFLLALVAVVFLMRPVPEQQTTAPSSPIIDGVSGDVTISYGG